MVTQFRVLSLAARAPAPIAFDPIRLILGGYSARSVEERERHIAELRQIGIEPPSHVPAFWHVSPWLLTTASVIKVQGHRTSGEVEFALLSHSGHTYATVASDQTDREFERYSIPRSKQLCPKVLSVDLVPMAAVGDRWDAIAIGSDVSDDGESWEPYQRGTLGDLLPPADLVRAACGGGGLADGTILLSGTMPLVDGETRYAPYFRARMSLPDARLDLALAYRVEVLPEVNA
jgi:hypothetical protein